MMACVDQDLSQQASVGPTVYRLAFDQLTAPLPRRLAVPGGTRRGKMRLHFYAVLVLSPPPSCPPPCDSRVLGAYGLGGLLGARGPHSVERQTTSYIASCFLIVVLPLLVACCMASSYELPRGLRGAAMLPVHITHPGTGD
jgi:hypothetical protein